LFGLPIADIRCFRSRLSSSGTTYTHPRSSTAPSVRSISCIARLSSFCPKPQIETRRMELVLQDGLEGADLAAHADQALELLQRQYPRGGTLPAAVVLAPLRGRSERRPAQQVVGVVVHDRPGYQTSRLRTPSALLSMNARRGSTCSPISVEKISSEPIASSICNLRRQRNRGVIVYFPN